MVVQAAGSHQALPGDGGGAALRRRNGRGSRQRLEDIGINAQTQPLRPPEASEQGERPLLARELHERLPLARGAGPEGWQFRLRASWPPDRE